MPSPEKMISGAVSLCMIVRDNTRTLAACLEGIRGAVDEMIVVDTGSTDETRQIAERLGAKVFEFSWCDDFSAARNVSLEHASGEWIFWMDSDDTIDAENAQKLREILRKPHAENVLGFVMQVHMPATPGQQSAGATMVDHVKLFRNLPHLRFEGRIHEQILPSIRRAGGTVKWTDIFVTHSGYDSSPDGRRRKQERDIKLIRLELQSNPEHSFSLFNLGMTCADMGRHTEAVESLEKCLACSKPIESHVRKAYALLATSLQQAGLTARALEVSRQGVGLYPEDTELLFLKGNLAQRLGLPDEAERAYRLLIDENGQKYFASVDSGIRSYKARHNLAALYMDAELFPEAEIQWRKILIEYPDYLPALESLVESLLRQKRSMAAQDALQDVLQRAGKVNESPQVLVLRGRVAAANGNLYEARDHFFRAVNDSPEDAAVLGEWCRFLFEFGKEPEAQKALLKLQQLDPRDAAACHNLGIVYMRTRRFAEAAAQFRRSLELRPNYPATLQLLAEATAHGAPVGSPKALSW
jgi:O-antigen biosynthesis protein